MVRVVCAMTQHENDVKTQMLNVYLVGVDYDVIYR